MHGKGKEGGHWYHSEHEEPQQKVRNTDSSKLRRVFEYFPGEVQVDL